MLDEVVSRQMAGYDVLFALIFKRLYELFDIWMIADLLYLLLHLLLLLPPLR